MLWTLWPLGANRVLVQMLMASISRLILGTGSTSQLTDAVARPRVSGCEGNQREAGGKRERSEACRSVEGRPKGGAYGEADDRGPGV